MKSPGCCAFLCVVSAVLLASTASAQEPGTPAVSGPASSSPASASSAACAALAKLSLPHTRIDSAAIVAAGAFSLHIVGRTIPDPEGYKRLPAFCRVTATLTPSADSDIKIEVWLPVAGWNSKFRGQGNGGFAGEIDYDHLAWAVAQGYATGGTDTGHTGGGTDASWALGHPEKVVDFGNRAVHEMTLASKAITAAYYHSTPRRSYFASCSDGGREALMEAQRFPSDYDGILAGAPANNWTHLLTNAAHNAQTFALDPAAFIPPAKLPAIAAAVADACDASDGVKDGILNDPRQCRFDPSVMLCKQGDTGTCLTAPQVAAMKSLYAGAHDASGKLVFPGYLPGSEVGPNGWTSWITGTAPGKSLMTAFGSGYFSDMVYADPKWDLKSFNVDQGLKDALQKTAQALDSTDPNLKPFLSRGGKLILYHGWNDPAISALNTIDYYQNAIAVTGQSQIQSSVRLYMAPGVQHCFLGPGADTFGQYGWDPDDSTNDPRHSLYSALEQWVEKGAAPDKVIATRYAGEGASRHPVMTRPLCPYPQLPRYKGAGDPNNESSFTCAVAAK